MTRGWRRTGFRILALSSLLGAMPVLAQLPTATLLGTVTDPQGAVVAGATVTARNTDTGFSRSVTTGAEGTYRLNALSVGNYEVEVTREGFKTETRTGLTLLVAEETVVNMRLQVGSAAQRIVVTEEVPLVETTNASLGSVLSQQQVSDLPLNGRNYLDLTLLQTGVLNVASEQGTPGGIGGAEFVSNGATPRSNNFMLDGAIVVNGFGLNPASASGSTLGADGIKELRVITNLFSAEYGLTMGSQTTMVSKGGTNQFHGDVFEYLRNSALDARNFFGTGRKPNFQRNQFGGSFGGPIKKDKTFFYGVFEALRENLGLTSGSSSNLPLQTNLPEMGCRGPANATITVSQCPQLSPMNSVTINPLIAPLLDPAILPLPNQQPGDGFTYSPKQIAHESYGQMRVDHNLSSADSLFARYTVDDTLRSTPGNFPGLFQEFPGRSQFVTLAENHIFSPSLLNAFRASFTRSVLRSNATGSADFTKVLFVTGAPFTGGFSAPGWSDGVGLTQFLLQNVGTFSDDVFWNKGRHAFKFGTLINLYDQPNDIEFVTNGSISFASIFDFLAGNTASYFLSPPLSNDNRNFHYKTYGFYAQDDVRVTSRFTVNLGLRYEFRSDIRESNGREFAFRNFATDSPFNIPPAGTTKGPILQNDSLHDFSPRIGFAWNVFGDGKTSVRGGAGIFYDLGNIGALISNDIFGTPPTSFQTIGGFGGAPLQLPLDTIPPVVNPSDPNSWVGVGLSTVDYRSKQPYMIQYNLSIERQLPGNIALSVSYVGSRGIHLWSVKEGNPAVPDQMLDPQNPACGTSSAPANCAAAQPRSNSPGGLTWSCSNGDPACRLNPNYGDYTINTTTGDSYYNSLQVAFQKRVGHGLEFQSSYTYSKLLDTGEGQIPSADATAADSTNPYDSKFDKGPSEYDATHIWSFNSVYHFPSNFKARVVSKLLNGWWTGSIVSVRTGFPFSPGLTASFQQSNDLNTYGAQERPDFVTNSNLAAAQTLNPSAVIYNPKTVIIGGTGQSGAPPYFNPNMFTLQAPGTLGDVPRGLLRGPGSVDWDFSISKDTKLGFLGEAGNLQFRAEFFNVLNHPSFVNPSGIVFNDPSGTISTATAGVIPNTVPNIQRQIQFGLRIDF
jgi:hypothetical protein